MPEILKPRKAPSNFLVLRTSCSFPTGIQRLVSQEEHLIPADGPSILPPQEEAAPHPHSGQLRARAPAAERHRGAATPPAAFRAGPSIFQQKTCQCREPARGASHGAALPAPGAPLLGETRHQRLHLLTSGSYCRRTKSASDGGGVLRARVMVLFFFLSELWRKKRASRTKLETFVARRSRKSNFRAFPVGVSLARCQRLQIPGCHHCVIKKYFGLGFI